MKTYNTVSEVQGFLQCLAHKERLLETERQRIASKALQAKYAREWRGKELELRLVVDHE